MAGKKRKLGGGGFLGRSGLQLPYARRREVRKKRRKQKPAPIERPVSSTKTMKRLEASKVASGNGLAIEDYQRLLLMRIHWMEGAHGRRIDKENCYRTFRIEDAGGRDGEKLKTL